ncbi:MAG: hypothetical protein H7099_03825 [Gemmatimonadaceae bacterium]|nr:hypothetical protein [Gemmatimonadaceae bacterium]
MSEELDRAMQEAKTRLKDRGVVVSMHDDSDVVAQVLEAVERFEKEVERQGGDLMVDTGDAEQPDDPRFVLPKRVSDEVLPDYRARIDEATRLLKKTAR